MFFLSVYRPSQYAQNGLGNYLAKGRWTAEKAPAGVTENGKKVASAANAAALEKKDGWFYDEQSNVLWDKTKRTNKEDINLTLKL